MKKKSSKKRKKKSSSNRTSINRHTVDGKKLIPPFARIPNLQPISWIDDRLPELLWAALLVTNLYRDKALDIFRQVGKFIEIQSKKYECWDITHTGLSKMPEKVLYDILGIITKDSESKEVLRSLLMLNDLPAKEHWKKLLHNEDKTISNEPMMKAVAECLDHQSQASTDCRWLRILCVFIAEKFHVPTVDHVKEIIYYPDFGDMRKVRPTIRSEEGTLDMLSPVERSWANKFWDECLFSSTCIHLTMRENKTSPKQITSMEIINQVYLKLILHMSKTQTTSKVDAKHDTVFGFALYSLNLLKDLLIVSSPESCVN